VEATKSEPAAQGASIEHPATEPAGADWTVPLTVAEEQESASNEGFSTLLPTMTERGAQRLRRAPTLESEPVSPARIEPAISKLATADAKRSSLPNPDASRRVLQQENRKIITLRLAAEPHFEGSPLQSALEMLGLRHGKYGVFHRLTEWDESVFSVANMTEPGAFDVGGMSQARFAGLTLFALLPGPLDAVTTFTQLLTSATQLQQALGGELQDDRGVPLTAYRINRIREEVASLQSILDRASS
jgi:FtsZ-interacting cell division protein ZipA